MDTFIENLKRTDASEQVCFFTASSLQACPITQDLAFPEQTISSALIPRHSGGLVKMPECGCICNFGRLITIVVRSLSQWDPCAFHVGNISGPLKSQKECLHFFFINHQFSALEDQNAIAFVNSCITNNCVCMSICVIIYFLKKYCLSRLEVLPILRNLSLTWIPICFPEPDRKAWTHRACAGVLHDSECAHGNGSHMIAIKCGRKVRLLG